MLHNKFMAIGSAEKDFKFFYHSWAWRPRWSCYLDPLNILLFIQPLKALYEIQLQFSQLLWMRCLNVSKYYRPTWTSYTLNTSCIYRDDCLCQFIGQILVSHIVLFCPLSPEKKEIHGTLYRTFFITSMKASVWYILVRILPAGSWELPLPEGNGYLRSPIRINLKLLHLLIILIELD